MMKEPLVQLNDQDLDKLLSAVAQPPRLDGFEQRLANRLAALNLGAADNVVPFRRASAMPVPMPRRSFAPLRLAAALAASLVLGVFLGTNGNVVNAIDTLAGANTDQVAEFAPTGIDDLGRLEGESQS